MRLRILVLTFGVFCCATPGLAQDTRDETLKAERQKKAEQLEPYKPGKVEKWLLRIENDRLLERVFGEGKGGFFPRVGRITNGGGIGFGPGFRRRGLFGNTLDFTASAAVSSKRYWVAESIVSLPRLARNHAFADFRVGLAEYPQEDFFGLGPDSFRPDRVNFLYRETRVGGRVGVRPTPWLTASTRAEWLHPSIGRGTDVRFQSIEERFTDADAPGLLAQPDFMHYEGTLDLNYTTPRGNPRRGGRYILSVNSFEDQDFDRYSFRRYDLDVRQYIPFIQARRVIALRGYVSTSDTDSGNDVPFYLQQTLGGNNTLRGFRDFRFRDRHQLLLQSEYRWEIYPALDAALFYEAGKVASRRRDLSLNHLESDYGFGFRFGTAEGVMLRIDAAFGSQDGKHYFIRFSNVF